MTADRRPAGVECRPRFMTPRTPSRPTLGPRVAEVARALGKPLLPWQRDVVDTAMEINPDTGRLAYPEVDLLVMRQNGKSELLFPVMTHRAVGFDRALTRWLNTEYGLDLPAPGAQRIMYTAQTAELARARWRDVHVKRLEESALADLVLPPRLRQAQEQMTFRSGSSWIPGSTTAKGGGTGDTLDLGVIDEAWAHPPSTELSMRPTMLTRWWRQLWVVSMVPGPRRRAPGGWPYLWEKMRAGRARVESGARSGVFYCEFSAQPGSDPMDPRTWWSAMPALGHTVWPAAIAEDAVALGLADFEAEYLGWEPKVGSPRWLVVGETAWRDRADPSSSAADPVALSVSSTTDLSSTTIAVAGLCDEDDPERVHVEVVDRRPGIEWAAARVVEVVEQWGACAIAIDPANPASALIGPIERALADEGIDCPVLRPNSREVARADSWFVEACGVADVAAGDDDDDDRGDARPARRLSHMSQPELDRAVASCERKFTGQLWRFVEAMPGADVSPVRAVSLALWAGDHVEWMGAAYDIASTLG